MVTPLTPIPQLLLAGAVVPVERMAEPIAALSNGVLRALGARRHGTAVDMQDGITLDESLARGYGDSFFTGDPTRARGWERSSNGPLAVELLLASACFFDEESATSAPNTYRPAATWRPPWGISPYRLSCWSLGVVIYGLSGAVARGIGAHPDSTQPQYRCAKPT